jgi:hypothetical protein
VTQARRPADGRVVVLAYAVGLEDFDDTNGSNAYESPEAFRDLPDAFVDADKSGVYSGNNVNGDVDTPVPYRPFALGNFLTGDGVRGQAHIRASTVLYMSAPSGTGNPTVVIPNSSLSQTTNLLSGSTLPARYVRIDSLNGCASSTPQADIELYLDDGYGNPMAAGTSLVAPGSNFTDNLSQKALKPSSVLALGTRSPSVIIDGASNGNGGNQIKELAWTSTNSFGNVVTRHVITVAGVSGKCVGNGSFALEATSPRGAVQTVGVLHEGQARGETHPFDVRFLDRVSFSLDRSTAPVSTDIELVEATFNMRVGVNASSYSIRWGDGTSLVSGSLPISGANLKHQYAAAGTYTVTMTVTDGVGAVHTGTRTVVITAP